MKLDPPFWATVWKVVKPRWREDLFVFSAWCAACLLFLLFFKQ